MDETGDTGLLDAPVAFADAPRRRAPLYNHVCLGLEWLWRDRTRRGLSRIGQGDWNDPLNMAGLEEKGESIWLSCALALALDAWAAVAARRGDTARAARYRRRAARLRAAVNRYGWDGRWYVRGFTDAGQPFGSAADREGRIFLNAQSWAIMCGAAGPERTRSCIRSVERMLMTPAGPVTLAPAYTRMHTAIGKLTQKVAGWNENGSVYCHAATFYACALYAARSPDKAFDALRRLLPGHPDNPVARCGQVPLYIPNFYRGAACGRKAGLSSHFPNTGTVSWYYRTVVAMLLGVRAEPDGLRIDPQLPSHWKRADVRRTWRGAVFDVRIRRRAGERGVTVRLDGRRLPDNLLPVQRRGTRHVVSVTLGA
jgi:cellobionic acid phosphorylase